MAISYNFRNYSQLAQYKYAILVNKLSSLYDSTLNDYTQMHSFRRR